MPHCYDHPLQTPGNEKKSGDPFEFPPATLLKYRVIARNDAGEAAPGDIEIQNKAILLISGHTQFDHSNIANPKLGAGVYKIKEELMKRNFPETHITLMSEDGVHNLPTWMNPIGEGGHDAAKARILNKVKSLVDTQDAFGRKISLGMAGYSHGAGMTYWLAAWLHDERFGKYDLRATGYVDAVARRWPWQDADLWPESRRPEDSAYHRNIYQGWGVELKGAFVGTTGDPEFTVNTDLDWKIVDGVRVRADLYHHSHKSPAKHIDKLPYVHEEIAKALADHV